MMDGEECVPMEMDSQVPAHEQTERLDPDGLAFVKHELQVALKKPDACLTPEQESVIACVLSGTHVLYIDRTGAGKSASYFLATKLLRTRNKRLGPTLIMSPLIALMNDQLRKAREFGLSAFVFNSSTKPMERDRIVDRVVQNTVDVIFITPEMLSGNSFRENFHQFNREYEDRGDDPWGQIALIVIDEVHCVSDWGHDFRPSYFQGMLELSKLSWFEACTKIATSATVNTRVERDIQKGFPGDWQTIRGNLFRANMAIRVVTAYSENAKMEWLYDFFREMASPRNWNVLIFAMTQKLTEGIALKLRTKGVAAIAYHSSIANREVVERDFVEGRTKVVVATIALGMGFDKDDINAVVHWNTPASPVAYYQEIGRAGRKLAECKAFILLDKGAPFRTDGKQFDALRKVVNSIAESADQRMRLRDVQDMLSTVHNFKLQIQEAAIMTAIKRLFIRQEGEEVALVRRLTNDDITEFESFSKEREEEARFMKDLFSEKSQRCIWRELLRVLGQQEGGNFLCRKCSVCHPRDGGPIAKLTSDRSMCYRTKTPAGLEVFGLGIGNDQITSKESRFRKILMQHVEAVGLNPPAWSITYVPNARDDTNKQTWVALSEEFQLPQFEFIRVAPNKRGVTGINDEQVRWQILSDKLSFDFSNLPTQRNVIIYDDAVRSGSTIDFVAAPLRERGFRVVAIVDRIWEQMPESLPLD